MGDRLDEIKGRDTYWPVSDADIEWLIAQVEQLRVENDRWLSEALKFEDFNARVAAENEVERLRVENARLAAIAEAYPDVVIEPVPGDDSITLDAMSYVSPLERFRLRVTYRGQVIETGLPYPITMRLVKAGVPVAIPTTGDDDG